MLYDFYTRAKDLNYYFNYTNNYALEATNQIKEMLSVMPLGSFPQYGLDILEGNLTLLERYTRIYDKKPWLLEKVTVGSKEYVIKHETVEKNPFCNLIKFSVNKTENKSHPVFLIAPMSGHYATLLKNTIMELLKEHDVYITDWINPRDVSLEEGIFTLDCYIDYIVDYSNNHMPKNYSIVCVCQPTVPVSIAIAYMSSEKSQDFNLPKNLILMGGPMRLDNNENDVTEFAKSKSLKWFEYNLIYKVPNKYKGAGRRVYPGFLQLSSFIYMNLNNHIQKHVDLWDLIANGEQASARKIEKFYDEYFAVMDLDAQFYLETLDRIFKKRLLNKSEFPYRKHKLGIRDISAEIDVLMIEGEKDDIAKVGQTSNIKEELKSNNKESVIFDSIGHYGLFNGGVWSSQIRPKISEFIKNKSK